MIPLPFSGIAVRTRAFIATVLLVMTMQDTAAKPLDSRPAPEFAFLLPSPFLVVH
jgi:hypothetical protein